MKLLNQILITIGTLALLGVCVFFWVAIQSSHFEAQAKPFTSEYLGKLSESWEFSDVAEISSPEFLSAVSSTQGRSTLSIFEQFGSLTAVSDFYALHTTVHIGSTRGIYQFKASFTKTETVGVIDIIQIEDQLRVQSLRLNATSPLPVKASEFEA